MDRADVAIIISILSAVTAVGLGLLRLYEFVADRRPLLGVSVALDSDPKLGNTITIYNSSKVPANICYFDLIWVLRHRLFGWRIPFYKKLVDRESPLNGDNCNIIVPPHGTSALYFREMDHFGWGVGLKQDIYLRLWLFGRRSPVQFWVTGPREH